jgi:fructose-specific phosphotransferase system IIC component
MKEKKEGTGGAGEIIYLNAKPLEMGCPVSEMMHVSGICGAFFTVFFRLFLRFPHLPLWVLPILNTKVRQNADLAVNN